jgi:hypothetical protein
MNKRHAKTIALFVLKLAGTVLFLWWAFSRIEDKSTLGDNFYRALRSPFWVFFGLAMALFSLLANAFRWQFLLRAQEINQPFGYIFRLTLYGAFFNIVSLGGAAGDAAKIVLLIRRLNPITLILDGYQLKFRGVFVFHRNISGLTKIDHISSSGGLRFSFRDENDMQIKKSDYLDSDIFQLIEICKERTKENLVISESLIALNLG